MFASLKGEAVVALERWSFGTGLRVTGEGGLRVALTLCALPALQNKSRQQVMRVPSSCGSGEGLMTRRGALPAISPSCRRC
jgi:hypothetical protein